MIGGGGDLTDKTWMATFAFDTPICETLISVECLIEEGWKEQRVKWRVGEKSILSRRAR